MKFDLKMACAFCLVFLTGAVVGAQENRPATKEEVRALATSFQAERAKLLKESKHATPAFLLKADELAKRGTAALTAGQLSEAQDAFRKARWQLPYLPAQMPGHVVRVLGNMRLRH